jgi:hypothetical protein
VPNFFAIKKTSAHVLSGSAHARVLFRFHVSLRAGLQEELVEVEPEQQLRQVR